MFIFRITLHLWYILVISANYEFKCKNENCTDSIGIGTLRIGVDDNGNALRAEEVDIVGKSLDYFKLKISGVYHFVLTKDVRVRSILESPENNLTTVNIPKNLVEGGAQQENKSPIKEAAGSKEKEADSMTGAHLHMQPSGIPDKDKNSYKKKNELESSETNHQSFNDENEETSANNTEVKNVGNGEQGTKPARKASGNIGETAKEELADGDEKGDAGKNITQDVGIEEQGTEPARNASRSTGETAEEELADGDEKGDAGKNITQDVDKEEQGTGPARNASRSTGETAKEELADGDEKGDAGKNITQDVGNEEQGTEPAKNASESTGETAKGELANGDEEGDAGKNITQDVGNEEQGTEPAKNASESTGETAKGELANGDEEGDVGKNITQDVGNEEQGTEPAKNASESTGETAKGEFLGELANGDEKGDAGKNITQDVGKEEQGTEPAKNEIKNTSETAEKEFPGESILYEETVTQENGVKENDTGSDESKAHHQNASEMKTQVKPSENLQEKANEGIQKETERKDEHKSHDAVKEMAETDELESLAHSFENPTIGPPQDNILTETQSICGENMGDACSIVVDSDESSTSELILTYILDVMSNILNYYQLFGNESPIVSKEDDCLNENLLENDDALSKSSNILGAKGNVFEMTVDSDSWSVWLLSSPRFSSIMVSIILCIFALFYRHIQNWREKRFLMGKINILEGNLFTNEKETLILKEKLSQSELKLMSAPDLKDVEAKLKDHREREMYLRNQMAYLQKELQMVTDSSLEMNDALRNTVKELDTYANENQSLQVSIHDMQIEMEGVMVVNECLKEENQRMDDYLSKLRLEFNMQVKTVTDLTEKRDNLMMEIEERIKASDEIEKNYKLKIKQLHEELDEMSLNVSKAECRIKELSRAYAIALGDENAASTLKSSDFEGDVHVASLESLNRELERQLRCEKESRRILQGNMEEAACEISQLEATVERLEKENSESKTKLAVLQDYFKEKEIQLLQELKNSGADSEKCLSSKLNWMKEEIANLKKENEDLKKEIEDQETSYKSQIANLEEKSRENWLGLRQMERKYKECELESSDLRKKILLLEEANNATLLNGAAARSPEELKPVGNASCAKFIPPKPPSMTPGEFCIPVPPSLGDHLSPTGRTLSSPPPSRSPAAIARSEEFIPPAPIYPMQPRRHVSGSHHQHRSKGQGKPQRKSSNEAPVESSSALSVDSVGKGKK